jgi:SAM-dependent methyltransferase
MIKRRLRYLKAHYSDALAKPMLDVGCGDGSHLYDFAPGSVGLEGRTFKAREGYRIVHWNFGEELTDALVAAGEHPSFKYVWCNDVFEHVLAPHPFLLNLRRVLDDDGVLFLGVPLVNGLAFPNLSTRSNIFNYFCGYLSQDHVNFFTFQTLKHTVEYAGFDVDGWYSPFFKSKRPPMFRIEPVTVLALRKRPNFNYGPKAYKVLDEMGRLRWKELVGASDDERERAPEIRTGG